MANWVAEPSYLESFSVVPPGSSSPAQLNSCARNSDVPEPLRCSGHGRCKDWFTNLPGEGAQMDNLRLCECDLNWAGPECATPQLSQFTAFVLSVFTGIAGVDQFYLGFWVMGALKLCSLGGCGFWWVYDVVRIGSSSVHAADGIRLAADLPHWAFVLMVVAYSGVLGFALSIWSIHRQRLQKARELLLLRFEAQSGAKSYASTLTG